MIQIRLIQLTPSSHLINLLRPYHLIQAYLGMSSIFSSEKIRLSPLDIYRNLKKKQASNRSSSQFKTNHRQNRYKTQADIHEQALGFNSNDCSNPRLSKFRGLLSEKQQKSQYELLRKFALKSESKLSKDRSLPSKHHPRFKIKAMANKNLFSEHLQVRLDGDSPAKRREESQPERQMTEELLGKIKSLEKNAVNILKILQAIESKADLKQLLLSVKAYVLEEESDLNDLEIFFGGKEMQKAVKTVIFFQRAVFILLVESIIHAKFKINELHFKAIANELVAYYNIILTDLAKKSVATLAEDNKINLSLQKSKGVFQTEKIYSIRDSIQSKLRILSRSFKSTDSFIRSELAKVEKMPTNLLYYNLLEYFAYRLVGNDWAIWNIQFLETCPSPYVHHAPPKKYTLLLDLDETLIHYQMINSAQGQFLMRPFVFEFLKSTAQFYEIGVFTCSLKEYADIVLAHMKEVSFRLYRQHAVKIGHEFVKDLSRVGRDLKHTLMVDNLERNFRMQKENGIAIKSWYGDTKDTLLQALGAELIRLASSGAQDFRKSNHRKSFD